MKSFAHVAGLTLVLAGAGLISGCSSTPSTAAYRQPAQDFEVVESSTQRPLNEAEMAEVRASVAAYLDREGATDGGDYYLKVFLKPEDVDADSEWVVVRFTRYTAQRVAVVSSYPYDNYLYSPYYAYDLYPYGYGCVTRISFQYYVDPFYHEHFYYPYWNHGGRKGGHHDNHDTAHNHGGGRPGGHGGSGGNHNPGNHGPGNPPSSPPVANNPPSNINRNPTYPRQSPPAGGGKQHYEDIQPHRRWRGRPGVDGNSQDVANNENRPIETNDVTPAPTPNPTPAPANANNTGGRPGSRPAHRPHYNPNPAPQGSGQPNPAVTNNRPPGSPAPQWRQRNPNPNPAPNGMNNAPRTADRGTPTPPRPAQPNRPAPASYRPAPQQTRPTPSYQPAPQRNYSPSSQPPARVAPPSSDSDRPGTNNSREQLR